MKVLAYSLATFLCVLCSSTNSFAQSFESLLSELNSAMKFSTTMGELGEALFDKHNCILHLQGQEFTLKHLKLTYTFNANSTAPEHPHEVMVECLKFYSDPCAGENTLSYVFLFSEKRSAIGFLNAFNDLIVLARTNGFCEID